ncbi:MAG: hypothetical protein CFK49_05515 [Armatimonadetes bacterium JP3_11]|nr:MAG: hypothetical protein CFK49_05515 [Armatimonadetes bacterium JP3_11]
MKAIRFWSTLMLILCTNAFAQTVYVDEFEGGFSPDLPWTWSVIIPNEENPCDYVNTENSDYPYFFDGGALHIVMHPWNSTYNQWNYAANFPTLPVLGFDPGWAIETEISLNLQGNIPTVYTQAGLMLMRDMDNYYQAMLIVFPNDGTNPHKFWLSTAHEVNRDYQYGGASAGFWGENEPSFTLKLRLEDAGVDENNNPLIKVRVQLPGWTDFVDVWPSPFAMPQMVQSVAQQGGLLSLFNVAGFTGDPQPVASFAYIRLENIRLAGALEGDVDGNGCVDDADLLTVLFAFGSGGELQPADVNKDCVVDDADLLSVLFQFGNGC